MLAEHDDLLVRSVVSSLAGRSERVVAELALELVVLQQLVLELVSQKLTSC